MGHALAPLAFALAALSPASAPIVMPTVVAAPTPTQVHAVSGDVVKFLQTGAFDPDLTPTGAPTRPVVVAAPANPLDGTAWVRETTTCRVVVRFVKDMLQVEVVAPARGTLVVTADYALGRDGQVFGVVTTLESPVAEGRGLGAKLLAADGAPYCFRFRLEGDTLLVRDFRCSAAKGTYAVLGAYKKLPSVDAQ